MLNLLRRVSSSGKWEQLRRSDVLRDLLDELAFWTALWNGFPLSRDDHAAPHRARLGGRAESGSLFG